MTATYPASPQDANTQGTAFYYYPQGQSAKDATERIELRIDEAPDPIFDDSILPTILMRSDHGLWHVSAQTPSAENHADAQRITVAYMLFRRIEKRLSRNNPVVEITAESILERWLRIYHGWSEVTVSGYHGYVQSDWGVVVRGYTPDFLKEMGLPAETKRDPGEGHELTAWARGDVWIAGRQIPERWTGESSLGRGRMWTEWQPMDESLNMTVYGSSYALTQGSERDRFDPRDLG